MNAPLATLRARLGFLARDSLVYGLGGALNKAITLITFPILARHFAVADFGLIDLLNTSVVMAVTLLVFGQDSAVARYFYVYEDAATRRQVVSQSFALQMGLLVLVVPSLWLAAGPLAAALGVGRSVAPAINLTVLQLPFFVLINFSQGILKWTFQRQRFLLISVGSTLGTLAGILATLHWFDLDIVSLFGVYLGVRALFGVCGLWFVRHWLAMPAGLLRLRELLPYALPFGIVCAASAVLPVLERNVVAALVGGEGLGLFAAGAKVAMLVGVAINAFETSWGPFSLSIFRAPDAERTFQVVLRLVAVALCAVALLLAAFGDLVATILGSSKYAGAGVVVFALTMSMVVQAIGAVTEVGITFALKSYLKLWAYAVGLAIAAVAIPLGAARWGIAGAAWGSLCAYAGKALADGWLAQRAHRIEWRYRGPLAVCAVTLAIGLTNQIWFDHAEIDGIRWIPLIGIGVLAGAAWIVLHGGNRRGRLLPQLRAPSR